jgi:protoporphyrinogen IX oxidase
MLVLWLKALHVIAIIAFMAGMLYLPRLFVYHADAAKGGELSQTLKIMERRLYKAILNPSIVVVWITGPLLAWQEGFWTSPWLHAKLIAVLALSGLHGYFGRLVKTFAADANVRPARFYRILNEVPTVLMIFAVVMVVLKPF